MEQNFTQSERLYDQIKTFGKSLKFNRLIINKFIYEKIQRH